MSSRIERIYPNASKLTGLCALFLSTVMLGVALPGGLARAQDAPAEPVSAQPTQERPAQSAPAQAPVAQTPADHDRLSGEGSAKGAPAPAGEAFTIGASDVLLIHVMHEPELTGKYDVGPDGLISMTLAGPVKAAGLTGVQLAEAIRDKLKDTIRNPEVSVQVTQVNSRKFILQGEVRRPGSYALITPMTVLEAVSLGQGFTDWANTKKIYVLRKGERLKFNYKDVSHGKHMEDNIMVENGDQIFVP